MNFESRARTKIPVLLGAGVPLDVQVDPFETKRLVLENDALRVRLWKPGTQRDDQKGYPVDISIFGRALAHSASGLSPLLHMRERVLRLLFPEAYEDPTILRLLAGRTLPGRFDLHVDVSVQGTKAASFFEREVVFEGLPALRKTHYRMKLRGKPIVWRSERGNPLGISWRGRRQTLRIYRKRTTFSPGTREAFESTWTAAGWDGEAPILRVEFSMSREVLGTMNFGHTSGRDLSFDVFLAHLPAIGAELTTRHRHCSYLPTAKANDRKNSPFWDLVSERLGRLADRVLLLPKKPVPADLSHFESRRDARKKTATVGSL